VPDSQRHLTVAAGDPAVADCRAVRPDVHHRQYGPGSECLRERGELAAERLQQQRLSDTLLTTSDLPLPEMGTNLVLGNDYNSLLVNSAVNDGADRNGWRQKGCSLCSEAVKGGGDGNRTRVQGFAGHKA
jgi:hypothetical protein